MKHLEPSDYDQLSKGSGLLDGTIKSRGYYTACTEEELAAIGFSGDQLRAPALVVPIHTVDGSSDLYQIRPHVPRVNDKGKPVKYETLAGERMRIDVPPSIRHLLTDPEEPLWITEGAKKADAAAQRGICCIDLLGVWNWRGRSDDGGVCELSDWDRIAIKGRAFYIAFDNDVMLKPAVRTAMIRLAAMLKRRGAREVHAVIFPKIAEGAKTGFDDYFVAGGRVVELEEYIDDDVLGTAIEISKKSLPELTTKALDAIMVGTDDPRVYVRANELVRVITDDRGNPSIDTLNVAALRGICAASVDWRKGGQISWPPKDVVENLLNLGEWPDIPGLVTIARSPVVTPTARLSCANGYDHEARVFVATGSDLPKWNGSAKAAAKWIFDEVLVDFPFSGDPDRAHALALMLLPIVRPFIKGPTPLHLFDAPVQGTGKSLAATVCLIPTQGDDIVVTPGTHDEEEWRKKIAAGLLSGTPYILFDNLTRKVDSETLALCITGTRWNDRVLGGMKLGKADIRCVWVATANNADLSRDILRRTCWIRLDAKMERPEDRTVYRHPHIVQWAAAERPRILSALLAIVDEWITTRNPKDIESLAYKGKRIGSLEMWCSVMGTLLEVAEVPGFLGNVDELRVAANAEDGALAEWYDRWWADHGPNPVKAKDVLDIFRADEQLAGMVGDKSDSVQGTRLGRLIANWIGVVRNGKRIQRFSGANGSNSYRLEMVKQQGDFLDLMSSGQDVTVGSVEPSAAIPSARANILHEPKADLTDDLRIE